MEASFKVEKWIPFIETSIGSRVILYVESIFHFPYFFKSRFSFNQSEINSKPLKYSLLAINQPNNTWLFNNKILSLSLSNPQL